MINLALIGAGDHAEKCHTPALSLFVEKNPDTISLAAVCDIDREKASNLGKKIGFQNIYGDIQQLLDNEKIDACLCIVPAKVLVKTAKLILGHNIPAVVEKPLGLHVDESRELLNFVQKTDTLHMVSANRRFVPLLNKAIAWCQKMGKIVYVKCLFARPNRTEPEFIWSTGVHAVDAMRYIAGDVVDFQISPIYASDLSNKWGHIAFQFKEGMSGSLDILPTCGQNLERYEIYGEGFRSVIEIHDFFREVRLQCWHNKSLQIDETMNDDNTPFSVRDGSFAEFTEFVEAIQNKRQAKPMIQDFIKSSEICHAIDQAISNKIE